MNCLLVFPIHYVALFFEQEKSLKQLYFFAEDGSCIYKIVIFDEFSQKFVFKKIPYFLQNFFISYFAKFLQADKMQFFLEKHCFFFVENPR